MTRHRQRWIYVGPGEGQGLVHVVTGRTRKDNVATWSDPVDDDAFVGGFSWFGPITLFRQVFRPVQLVIKDPPYGEK